MAPLALLLPLLPVIANSVAKVASDFDIIGESEAERITDIASKALARVPEAIDQFAQLKHVIGGDEPTIDQLRSLRLEIAAQSDRIEELRQEAHDRDA